MGGEEVQRAVSKPVPGVPAAEDHDLVVCHELQVAYDADAGDPPLWLADPVRYRAPHACVVPTALIRRSAR